MADYSFEQDLEEAEAMADALVPYVYKDILYGRVGANMPSLTVGALLLRIRRLDVLKDHLDASQQGRLEAVQRQNQEIVDEWRTHYTGKMKEEALSRLRNLDTYFKECREDPQLCAGSYRPEALRRTIIQEIVIAMEAMNAEDEEVQRKIRIADSQLRNLVRPDDFLWAETLEPAYPRQTFWWLYQRPPS